MIDINNNIEYNSKIYNHMKLFLDNQYKDELTTSILDALKQSEIINKYDAISIIFGLSALSQEIISSESKIFLDMCVKEKLNETVNDEKIKTSEIYKQENEMLNNKLNKINNNILKSLFEENNPLLVLCASVSPLIQQIITSYATIIVKSYEESANKDNNI